MQSHPTIAVVERIREYTPIDSDNLLAPRVLDELPARVKQLALWALLVRVRRQERLHCG
jgi:hypothetical protein